jgi:uncharacterized membrane protein YeaQ/YmgE (transglycosylase-associated protein family)
VLGTIIAVIASAFVTGALARLAVPGPDPMPIWLTVTIGLVGSVVGGAIAAAVWNHDPYAVSIGSFVCAVLLVIAYRRFVQKRPITGPKALRYPERGVGVPEYRERLKQVGIDPDTLPVARPSQEQPEQEGGEPPRPPQAEAAADDVLTPEERTEALRRLAEQRDAGELTAEEYRERRRRLVYGEDG